MPAKKKKKLMLLSRRSQIDLIRAKDNHEHMMTKFSEKLVMELGSGRNLYCSFFPWKVDGTEEMADYGAGYSFSLFTQTHSASLTTVIKMPMNFPFAFEGRVISIF